MAYDPLPNHKIPYDIDGSLVWTSTGEGQNNLFPNPPSNWHPPATVQEINDTDNVTVHAYGANSGAGTRMWVFLPVPWQVTHVVWFLSGNPSNFSTGFLIEGSNNTTNGVDGTWTAGGQPSGHPIVRWSSTDIWRTGIKPITFTQPYRVYRMVHWGNTASGVSSSWAGCHLYGTKGALAHDLVFIDASGSTPFASPHEFGDVQRSDFEDLSVMKAMRLRNVSESRTAGSVTVELTGQTPPILGTGLSLNSSGPWTPSIELGDISPETDSATFYVRAAPPRAESLGPRTYPLTATVGGPGFYE